MTSRKEFEKWADITTFSPVETTKDMCRKAWQSCTALHEAELLKEKERADNLQKSLLVMADKLVKAHNNIDKLVAVANSVYTLELDNKKLREALGETNQYLSAGETQFNLHLSNQKLLSTPPSTKALDEYWNQAVEACAEVSDLYYECECTSKAIRNLKKEV